MPVAPIIPIEHLFEVMLPGLLGALGVVVGLVALWTIQIGRDKATTYRDSVTRRRVMR